MIDDALWAERALLPDGWAEAVTLRIDAAGNILEVTPGTEAGDSNRLGGAVIPGVPNLHSHAHQRAMAGLGERAGPTPDSFWTWRKVMYHCLQHVGPDHLYAIARQLYLEMLKAGYTHVGEFQYLHHDVAGAAIR